jgi:long-chain acyl-CoA synthetase
MDQPWFKHYPPGMPRNIDSVEHQSLSEFFDHYHRKHAHHVAFECMGVRVTYHEVDQYATHFGSYLQHLGLKAGDRIAIQLPNILQFPVAFIGALKAGLIVVPTNPLYTPREMEHQFNDAGVKAIIILSNFAYNLDKIIRNTSIQHVIVTRIGDLLGVVKGCLTNFVIKRIKKAEPEYRRDGVILFRKALAQGKKLNLHPRKNGSEEVAVLQYTGGTTGLAKGAQLSHRNILFHTTQFTTWLQAGIQGHYRDIVITALPLYHIYSLTLNLMSCYAIGGKNVLIVNPRDINGFIKELKKHAFSVFGGVNTLFNALLNHPSFKTLDFSHLKIAGAGAMALQATVAARWKETTGVDILQGYGLSENSGALCVNVLGGLNKIDTVGVPLPSTELGIFDDSGTALPQGEVGEICARGPQVMKGYWNSENKDVFFEGNWFRTGDLGAMDADGYFKIVDRKKDMIIVSGLKVFPNEIENVIGSHPKVLECAVVGVPDEYCGEAVKLFVVKREPSLTGEELKRFCIENFAKYKIPKLIVFVDGLPKTPVGKILRRELRDR